MPVLKNARHERFAQELAQGKSASDAYVLAGYVQNEGNCIRLKGNERVQARVTELQGRAAVQAEVTVTSLIREAEQARVLAMENNQVSAAVAAIREKGVLSGKRIERAEQGRPGEFESMSADELRDSIARDLAALGREDLAAALVGGSGASGRLPH